MGFEDPEESLKVPRTKKQSTEAAVREIRRRTRRKFAPEEKIRIVLEGLRGEQSISELCRREGIAANLYYRWSKDFLERETLSADGSGKLSSLSGRSTLEDSSLEWNESCQITSKVPKGSSPITRICPGFRGKYEVA